MSTLVTALNAHRFAGLSATVLSFAASLSVALAPSRWDFGGDGLRSLMLGFAALMGVGSLLLAVASAVSVVAVVVSAPPNSGVAGRFSFALVSAGAAAFVFLNGRSRWSDPSLGAVLLAGALMLMALIAMVQLWTSLARASGNHQLADDVRNAAIAAIVGAGVHLLTAGSGAVLPVLLGGFAVVPGAVMTFRALGALARQLQYGSAWAT